MREERFTTPEPVHLDCAVTAGTIRVATVDGAESTVRIDGPAELVDVMRVDLVGDRLVVSEPRTSLLDLLARSDHSINLVVSLPHDSAVAVKTASSDAALDGTFGEIEMQSASADLWVRGEVDGDVTVKSASGAVYLPRVRGHVDLSGVSGDLRAASVDGSVTVKSVSGDVQIDALREGSVSVRSVSGDVLLAIEPGSAVDLDATSASGRLASEVPLSDAPEPGDHPTVIIRSITASGDIRVIRAAGAVAS